MNDKLAICMYGFLRDFNRHCLSLKENIIDPYDADIFGYFPYERDEDDHRKISNGVLEKVYGKNNVKYLKRWSYDPEEFIQKTKKFAKLNSYAQMPWRILSFFHHLSGCVELCLNSQKSYDWVFVTRPDISFYGLDLSVLDPSELNIVERDAHLVKEYGIKFDDKYLMGKESVVECLTSLYDDTVEYNVEELPAPNDIICKHFKKNGNSINRCNFVEYSFEHVCTKYCGHHVLEGDKDEDSIDYARIVEEFN